MRGLTTISVLGLALFFGCVNAPQPNEPSSADGNVGVDPTQFPNLRVAGEPNDDFSEPIDVIVGEDGRAELAGLIGDLEDVDVYAIDSLVIGDRLLVDVATPGSNLDSMVAVFDDQGRIAFENDDRDFELGQLDPFLNVTIRRDSAPYYLAIAKAPLGSDETGTGVYEILLNVVRGGAAAQPQTATVLLDFDGGSVDVPGTGTITVGPFDTSDIARVYTGMTVEVREAIVNTMRENYEGLALEILVAPGDTVPDGCTYSTLLFGGESVGAFGISQQIDPYNADRCDDAVVFTDMFTPSRFGRVLSSQELGIAIGNVAAHEMGHLLGLNHVADVDDLMDTTGGPSTFLADQDFLNSVLDDSIFPLGTQDAMLWLLETLGAVQ